MTSGERHDIYEMEDRAQGNLREPLRTPAELAASVAQLISELVLASTDGVDPDRDPVSKKVCLSLLVRIAIDLRCATLLAAKGYPMQAATLIAATYEIAITVPYIKNDEARAREWVEHDFMRDSFRSAAELIKSLPHAALDQESKCYATLCWAKHANPVLQRRHGLRAHAQGCDIRVGPDIHDDAVRLSWYALGTGGRIALVAAVAFCDAFLPGHSLREEIEDLIKLERRLRQEAIRRWGNVDPFPALWRERKRR